MPRKRKPKCPSRGQGPELDTIVEWSLTEWGGLPSLGLEYEELERAWVDHRNTITTEYTKQLPGQRPFGAYASGEIPLPEHEATPYTNEPPYITREGAITNYRSYFPTQQHEFEYLVKLGVVEGPELTTAKTRFATDCDWSHYKSIFHQHHEEHSQCHKQQPQNEKQTGSTQQDGSFERPQNHSTPEPRKSTRKQPQQHQTTGPSSA